MQVARCVIWLYIVWVSSCNELDNINPVSTDRPSVKEFAKIQYIYLTVSVAQASLYIDALYADMTVH